MKTIPKINMDAIIPIDTVSIVFIILLFAGLLTYILFGTNGILVYFGIIFILIGILLIYMVLT